LPRVYEEFYNKATNEKEKEILLDQVATLLVTCDKQLSIINDVHNALEEKSKGHK
jgi:hypothetical protein